MHFFIDFLTSHAALTIFLCLGLGFLVGRLRIGSFKLGATIGTLLVGILLSQFGVFEISAIVKTIFFSLFAFTVGFEVGPAFFSGMKQSGLKIIGLSCLFVAIAVGMTVAVCRLCGYDSGTAVGLFAGAFTQTSVIGASGLEGEEVTVTYAITYVFGTVGVILFAKKLGPMLLRQDLKDAVKEKTEKLSFSSIRRAENAETVQMRSFVIGKASQLVGKTVDEIEALFGDGIEVQTLYREGKTVAVTEKTAVEAEDVLVLLGKAARLSSFSEYDETNITESSDPTHYRLRTRHAEIVMTVPADEGTLTLLSENGILLREATKNGEVIGDTKELRGKNVVLSVAGIPEKIEQTAKKLGYLKTTGNTTDIAFMSLSIVAGLLIGYLSVTLGGIPFALGEGGGTLLAGLLCGWWYNKHPRVGYIPAGTRTFIKDIGLNLYIAVIGLSVTGGLIGVILERGWLLFLLGIPLTLVPHILTALFGKYVLKLDTVDILGGQSGCGTVSAALNALTEETGSSVFALSYAPGYAVGQILLTLAGVVLPLLL